MLIQGTTRDVTGISSICNIYVRTSIRVGAQIKYRVQRDILIDQTLLPKVYDFCKFYLRRIPSHTEGGKTSQITDIMYHIKGPNYYVYTTSTPTSTSDENSMYIPCLKPNTI